MKRTELKSITKEIIDWNACRNYLQLDTELEEEMLAEELNEFMVAVSVEDHIDAYLDFLFVFGGTTVKYLSAGVPSEPLNKWWKSTRNWAEASIVYMGDMLDEHFQQSGLDERQVQELLVDCMAIVMEANNLKGLDKDNKGKVVKGQEWKDPASQIRELVESRTRVRGLH